GMVMEHWEYYEDEDGNRISEANFTVYDSDFKEIKQLTLTNPVILFGLFGFGSDHKDYYITYGVFTDEYSYILLKDGKYNVYNLDGNIITTIQAEGYNLPHCPGYGICYLPIKDKKYLLVEDVVDVKPEYGEDGSVITEGKSVALVFSLDINTGVNQIAALPTGKVFPKAPRRGENIKVTLGEQLRNEKCLIKVYSTDGQCVSSQATNPGQEEVQVSTHRFNHGVYVVNITSESGKTENTKIIIR
ncbi:MAG: T9SS type A sorting domain-containing protein, partial [Muribaculaceae bacterium]|nr:T9SS type A sorting domain-containing protein [Muribaculaceae bacterium]